MTKQISNIKS